MDAVRDTALDSVCADLTKEETIEHLKALDAFWRQEDNLYHRVRALFFLSAIHRFSHAAILCRCRQRAYSLRPLSASLGTAVRRSDQRLTDASSQRRPQRLHVQRTSESLSRTRIPNLGRSSSKERPNGQGKPVDVPHGSIQPTNR